MCYIDSEWVDFVNDLKESGIKIEEIREYKKLLEFIKWQSQHKKTKDDSDLLKG
jgi:XRE family transcriptional regulator of biofilm formation